MDDKMYCDKGHKFYLREAKSDSHGVWCPECGEDAHSLGMAIAYHDTRTGGYISGPREEVRSILGYGEEQWARYVRHANAQHPLAVKAAKNPGGLYLPVSQSPLKDQGQ